MPPAAVDARLIGGTSADTSARNAGATAPPDVGPDRITLAAWAANEMTTFPVAGVATIAALLDVTEPTPAIVGSRVMVAEVGWLSAPP